MVKGCFGLPGCGKSTILAKEARKALKKIRKGRGKYKRVLTNYHVEGVEKINFEELGKYDFTESLVLLDEITLDADNRDFKNFSKQHVEFFMTHRHQKMDIIYYTQDIKAVDKKIRTVTDKVYYIKGGIFISKSLQIPKKLIIPEEVGDIDQGYYMPKRIRKFLDTKRTFRPFWYRYFDSYERKKILAERKPLWWTKGQTSYSDAPRVSLIPHKISYINQLKNLININMKLKIPEKIISF